MAVEGATEALVAAFFFGIVLNAASAALVLYLRGYGIAAVFRDSQRLVLVLFLLSAALWAQIDFIAILLDTTKSSTPCQIGLIFSTIFDQFARFSIEQFLLWALNHDNGAKLSVMQLIPQVLVLARFLAGAVFIGFTRPQTDDFCVATTSALPVGILVTALDGVIILLLIIRAYSAGGVAKENGAGKGVDADKARALMSVLLGLVFWTGTSVPLLLGIRTITLAIRTALPAGGLLVVIISVAGGAGTLLTSRGSGSMPPEAPSPRRLNISRDISTSDTDYPPSRFEDLKEAAIRSSTTFVNPRQAPRVKDETSIGYPSVMDRALAEPMPPLPASIAPASGLARKLDRSASMKKNGPGLAKGKISISRPILQENAGQNPLSKIAVMDLQAAAVADRERRAKMQEEEESMPVGRSSGPLLGMAPEEALKRGISLRRKEVGSVATRESVFPGALDVAVASTTSAELSPGGEEARRRSPRQSLQQEEASAQEPASARVPSPTPVPELTKPRSESPQNNPAALQRALSRANIRPSRTLPSPKTPPPEPTKTPLQRRPTIGLPSNPRARGLKVADEPGSQHRTILFVNNIEYNDPLAVEAILKGAGNPAAKQVPAPETPGTSASVVNRPRPIPRKAADSPAQASPSPGHRRSKSGGSLVGRKSLLASTAGSPTQLPPLPALPRSATMPSRPHPNDTKSMTFEEKITLMFPSPPSANVIKRRSSVPDVPRIPASYLDMDSSPSEPFDRHRSNRTTKASVRTESVLEVDEIPRKLGNPTVNTADAAGSSWLRAFGNDSEGGTSKPRAAPESGKRGSSPIIPAVRASAWTETTYDRSEDDATNWSAANSPELAVRIPVAQRLGVPSSVRMPGGRDPRGSQLSIADNRSVETLPFILDTSTVDQADIEEPSPSDVEVAAAPEHPTWHRRVGDECPTFSDRHKTRSRKMSPPPPLSLNTMTTRKTIAIHVEPSPLESPGQAIREIQAQLKKLDSLEQATPQSASRRIALLEDLEREMGQQAEHWEEIKHDMIRDSLSSMQTTSPAVQDSRHASVASTINMIRDSTLRQSIGSERRASRVARMRGNVNPKVSEASVRNSGSPQLSKWQKRLTEAQMDYMDAQLLRTSNVNFLQLSRAQLASPTPPDSDDSEDEVPSLPKLEEVKVEKLPEIDRKRPSLWVPKSTVSAVPKGLLWTPVLKPVLEAEPALPGLSVRPAQRKEAAPLQIESSQLWRKPYNTANRSMSGLWRPLWASAAPPAEPVVRASPKTVSTSQKPPRPVTQRPPRRNKRVTLLPDILESPKPLPDNRGTLGIFQFPWGEKSDTASIQPRPSMYMAMPGTMTSGGPSFGMAMDARSKQLEPTEYSSSFFDDYDDEDDGNDETDSDEDESDDDGFDDSTLWEIASLLKTDAVPSRDSLLPPASGSVVYDYIDELASDEDGQEQSIVIGLAEPRDLFVEQQRDSATIESSTLLMLEEALESSPPAAKPAVRGLPANPKASLKTQASGAAKSPAEATPAPAMSRTLQQTAEVQRAETAQEQGSSGLWTPPSKADKPSAHRGLFVAESSRAGFRGTSEEPAAKHMTRTPRPVVQKPLDRLTSTSLWVPEDPKQSQRSWILGASTVKQQGLKLQRIQASPQEWKSALNEAIAASYPRIKRINASPAEWKAALEEAIALSARAHPAQAPFNPAVQHPVFAARSLVTRSEWSHPAATGYTYDVAAVHPVFFGSLAITCPEDAVHPAISAYAAKKLRRQRSKQRSDSSSRTRSTSRSRRKDDIRAQIRALEQQDGADDDRGLVYTSSAAPPPIPAAVFQSDSIQAQIEALEQERLFVERAAQEEYRRRTTTTATTTAMAVPEPVLVVETMPAGAETVQDLQRRMSMQIRQSLVFSAPAPAVATVKPNKSKPSVTVSTVEIPAPVSVSPISQPPTPQPEPHLSPLLWTPSPRPAPIPSPTPGLWSPVSRPPPAPSPWAEEDADAAAQRARRRRTVQKKLRRQEILAQIAAVERGANPFVDFAGMGLWAGKKGVVVGGGGGGGGEGVVRPRGWGRDWLHSVCVRRTRGVVLRY